MNRPPRFHATDYRSAARAAKAEGVRVVLRLKDEVDRNKTMAETAATELGGYVVMQKDGGAEIRFDRSEIQQEPKSVVYFIQCGDFVKIGFASDVSRRISGIKTSTPYEVTLLRTIAGTMEDEAIFHRRFAEHHHKREWFRLEGALFAEEAEDALLALLEKQP